MPTLPRRAALLALPALLAARSALAQRPAPRPAEVITDPRVETFALRATPEAEPWRIFLGRPAQPAPAGGFPVLFLLDGNATFPLAWHAQEMAPGATPAVLVGIGYPVADSFDIRRRFYDLTPETAAEYLQGRAEPPRTGGQDALLDAITGPLRAEVARRLPVDAGRQALFGHSLGGLCALHAFFTRPEAFGTVIAADPSIWWNNRSILQEQAGFLAGLRAAGGKLNPGIRLLIANSGQRPPRPAGSNPGPGMAGPGGRETAQALRAVAGLTLRYRHMAEETHGSMLPGAVQDALRFFAGDDGVGEPV
ncbi:hypothetical protein BKE38_09965 [Pseudoroseomonas deserti]|uniref:Esterase n=1 Tax=Teichococcus deserti TaxID=1817963 RepID=A0A1V2H475_9PROT|nr:alpha/beta hydrolase-fold protein [Pseudoroseomonas deserti]ONG54818.1 hypothetical protein BKE38_09965 [Pseudoroseomonas deserti]